MTAEDDSYNSGGNSPVGSVAFSRHYGCSVGNRAVLSLLQYKFTADNRSALCYRQAVPLSVTAHSS
jgi:hypothetical protein